MSDRRLSKPSAVTRPAATSSHSAASISAFRCLVPRTMSGKNEAPALTQRLQDVTRVVTEAGRIDFAGCPRHEPVGVLAHEEGDGRDAGRDDAARCSWRSLERRRMRREAAPADDPAQAEPIQRQPDRSSRCAGGRRWRSQALAGASKPWSCRSTSSSPCSPCVWLPGAACCQASSQRMKSAALTGAISRRSRPSVRRWMRASRRRSHHSIARPSSIGVAWALAGSVNLPRRVQPDASSRSTADSTASGSRPRSVANSVTVAGPLWLSQP